MQPKKKGVKNTIITSNSQDKEIVVWRWEQAIAQIISSCLVFMGALKSTPPTPMNPNGDASDKIKYEAQFVSDYDS